MSFKKNSICLLCVRHRSLWAPGDHSDEDKTAVPIHTQFKNASRCAHYEQIPLHMNGLVLQILKCQVAFMGIFKWQIQSLVAWRISLIGKRLFVSLFFPFLLQYRENPQFPQISIIKITATYWVLGECQALCLGLHTCAINTSLNPTATL